MRIVTSVPELREVVRIWRQNEEDIALVPTMGNLHPGHISLVRMAKRKAGKVVVSIFVNPAQFGPGEDFYNYPRTEQQDQALLKENAVDLLFLPAVATIYPQQSGTIVSVPDLANKYCGASRPGHFDGVALIVCKLLNMVRPDMLVLGEKDYQQLLVIRRMVADLDIPVKIEAVATVREADGLAMSSRNSYLSPAYRCSAPALYRSLCAAREAILAGDCDYQAVASRQMQLLEQAGLEVDYFAICRSEDLLPADRKDCDLIILSAIKLGKTRLIDNIHFRR